MSSHFSANQYESAFASQRLQNYQVPTKYKEHPSLRKGTTKVVANDRGHLNPDINRSACSPWGSFVGTWQMERKPIQLQTRSKLTAHLYRTNSADSRQSSRAYSARAAVAFEQSEYENSPGSLPPTPKNDSRPNTADSNSSWVVINQPPSDTPRDVADSRPASQASCDQQAAVGSRSPTPVAVHQSPSLRSPSVMSAIDEVSIAQTKSPTGSHQTGSQQQSRVSSVSGVRSPSGVKPSSLNKSQTSENALSIPHTVSPLEQDK